MKINHQNIVRYAIISIMALNTACTSDKKDIPVSDKFEITDSLISRLVIDTVHAPGDKSDLLFSARITANEDRRSELFPMVSGMVNSVSVRLGDQVSEGQALAVLSSSEMAGFDKEVISADAELRNAERSMKQAEQLYESGLSSAKDLEEAKNGYQIKKAELKRARSVLKLNGGSTMGLYTIKSPISGFVIEKNVTDHMQIRADNSKSLFTIADLSQVWAMVNIYESDISRIKTGDEVKLSTLSYPEQIFTGKIDKIYNLIDQETKVMNARVVISNPGYLLKPGMLGTVKVSGNPGISLPFVNSGAVIFDENKNYVLQLDSGRKIHVREVEIGQKTADKTYIKKGVNAGDQIIASKQVFLFESLKGQ